MTWKNAIAPGIALLLCAPVLLLAAGVEQRRVFAISVVVALLLAIPASWYVLDRVAAALSRRGELAAREEASPSRVAAAWEVLIRFVVLIVVAVVGSLVAVELFAWETELRPSSTEGLDYLASRQPGRAWLWAAARLGGPLVVGATAVGALVALRSLGRAIADLPPPARRRLRDLAVFVLMAVAVAILSQLR